MNVFESNVYVSSCQSDPDDERQPSILDECEGLYGVGDCDDDQWHINFDDPAYEGSSDEWD